MFFSGFFFVLLRDIQRRVIPRNPIKETQGESIIKLKKTITKTSYDVLSFTVLRKYTN